MKKYAQLISAACIMTTTMLATHAANADWKPTKDIELVVPNAPGGGNDLLARAVGNILTQEKLVPTSVVIVNKPGGAQAVGVAYAAANRAGDPHTLVLVSTGTQVTPLTVKDAKGYNDLEPIATLTVDDFFLVVDAKSKYKTAAEMVAAAKAKPRSVSIGIGGATDEMAVADLEAGTGAKFNLVRFGSTGESLNALLGGHVDATTGNPIELLSQIKAGAVRGVAVFRDTRFDVAPDVPTLAEQGIKVPTYQAWRGIAIPKGTTPEQIAYWRDVFTKVKDSQSFKDVLTKNVSTGMVLTGDAMKKYTDEQESLYKSLLGK
jgi:putative tricarboxylic transport membrane protein